MWQEGNETNFLFTEVFIFSNTNLIHFKTVPLDNNTPMETLSPTLVATLKVFNRYALQHVRYTELWEGTDTCAVLPRSRWEVHIRITIKEIGINARNWVESV